MRSTVKKKRIKITPVKILTQEEKAKILAALQEDICNNVSLLREAYSDVPVIQALCNIIDNGKNSLPSAFMKVLTAETAELLESKDNPHSSLAKLTDPVKKFKVKMVLSAFVHYPLNALEWPEISTLEELLIADQKNNFIDYWRKRYRDLDNAKLLSPAQLIAYQELDNQIRESDTATSLNDIFKPDSLFLKAKPEARFERLGAILEDIVSEDQADRIRNKTEAVPSIQTLMNMGLSSDKKNMGKKLFAEIPAYLEYTDPKKLLNSKKSIEEDSPDPHKEIWRENSFALQNALLEMRHDYIKVKQINKQRTTNLNKIDKLIKEVTDLLNHPKGKTQEQVFKAMRQKVVDAYQAERKSYVSGFYSWIHNRTDDGFLAELDNGDSRNFWFPRMLRAILRTHYEGAIYKTISDANSPIVKKERTVDGNVDSPPKLKKV